MNKIIDVSEHDGVIDWVKVKAAGYGAIIRCGYGQDIERQDDKRYFENVKECERLGIPYGVYLYSYAKNSVATDGEVKHVLRLLKGRKLTYPIFYDVEESYQTAYVSELCKVFTTQLNKVGYKVGIYASQYWWQEYIDADKLAPYVHKWVAKWSNIPPSISNTYLWQYTDKGSVPGVKIPCDVNILLAGDVEMQPGEEGGKRAISAGYYSILVDGLRVRRSPDLQGKIVAKYFRGEKVYLDAQQLKETDGYLWAYFYGSSGKVNYIAVQDLRSGKHYVKL